MAKGNVLSDGGVGKLWVVGPWTPNVAGAQSAAFTSSAEVALVAPNSFRGTGETATTQTEIAIPFGCRIAEVAAAGELLASGDEFRFRVRRHDSDANGTATDVISNSTDGSTVVDYVRITATAANQPQSVQYDGSADVSGSTAVGFVEAQAHFDVGDYLTVTAQNLVSADSVSHLQVFVSFIKDV